MVLFFNISFTVRVLNVKEVFNSCAGVLDFYKRLFFSGGGGLEGCAGERVSRWMLEAEGSA